MPKPKTCHPGQTPTLMRFTIAEIGHVPSFKNGKQVNALAVVRHVRKQVRQGRKPSLKGLKNQQKTKPEHQRWMARAIGQISFQLVSSYGFRTTENVTSTGRLRRSSTASSKPAPSQTTPGNTSSRSQSNSESCPKAKRAQK